MFICCICIFTQSYENVICNSDMQYMINITQITENLSISESLIAEIIMLIWKLWLNWTLSLSLSDTKDGCAISNWDPIGTGMRTEQKSSLYDNDYFLCSNELAAINSPITNLLRQTRSSNTCHTIPLPGSINKKLFCSTIILCSELLEFGIYCPLMLSLFRPKFSPSNPVWSICHLPPFQPLGFHFCDVFYNKN